MHTQETRNASVFKDSWGLISLVKTKENVEFVKGNKVLFDLGFPSSFSNFSPKIILFITRELFKAQKHSSQASDNFPMLKCSVSNACERFYIRPVLVLTSSILMSVALRIDFNLKNERRRLLKLALQYSITSLCHNVMDNQSTGKPENEIH